MKGGPVKAQALRFARLFLLALASQAVLLDFEHLTRSAVVAATVAAVETAFRQIRPVQSVPKGNNSVVQ